MRIFKRTHEDCPQWGEGGARGSGGQEPRESCRTITAHSFALRENMAWCLVNPSQWKQMIIMRTMKTGNVYEIRYDVWNTVMVLIALWQCKNIFLSEKTIYRGTWTISWRPISVTSFSLSNPHAGPVQQVADLPVCESILHSVQHSGEEGSHEQRRVSGKSLLLKHLCRFIKVVFHSFLETKYP